MKSWPDINGRFGERLYFEDREFERMMDDLRMQAGADVFREGAGIDVDLVLLKVFDLEADYVDLPTGVLGRTIFDRMGNAQIEVSRDLDEAAASDNLARRRLRTTLAHEVGHVACHSRLFIEDTATLPLFSEDDAPKKEEFLCREGRVGVYDERRYRGEWWEYQANRCMAALLLPRDLFCEKADNFIKFMGAASFKEIVRKGSGEDMVRMLAYCFDVSQQAVFYRLEELDYTTNKLQATLFSKAE